jgi:hypothetical protein
MLEFDARGGGGELPVSLGMVGIAVLLPGGDFVDEGLLVGDAPAFQWSKHNAVDAAVSKSRIATPPWNTPTS